MLPEPPRDIQVPYANCRPEWQGVGLGEKTLIVLKSPAWQAVMIPELEALDTERSRRGPTPSYTSAELESAVLFQKLAGVSTYKEARNLLAGDREAATREALGFDKPRKRYGRGITLVKSLDGVPSEATIWRHQQRWGLARHIAAYGDLFQALLEEHLADPEFQEETRVLNLDGSVVRSHYTSRERLDRKSGELRPPTLEEGGFMARTKENAGKDGHGFSLMAVTTASGLPLAYRMDAIQVNEGRSARQLMQDQWRSRVVPHLDPQLRVLSADAAFTARELRAEFRALGILENTHPVSHARRQTSQDRAADYDAMEWAIKDHPNWRVNGHREIHCLCGQNKTVPRISLDKKGRTISRVEGSCRKCGSITITSGKWRAARNPQHFTLLGDGEKPEQHADLSFGNPLTFNNPLSQEFGRARFGHGEGFHGHLVTRFGLLKEKSWYRSRKQAELDFLIVFCAMHTLAIEQRNRAKARVAGGAAAGTGGAVGGGAQQAKTPPGTRPCTGLAAAA